MPRLKAFEISLMLHSMSFGLESHHKFLKALFLFCSRGVFGQSFPNTQNTIYSKV